MALFNFRWPGRAAQDDGKRGGRQRRAVSTESVDALRRRARHRLIGAAVLLVAGVVGFPLLFDTQPRPIPVDIPITMPDRGQAGTGAAPAAAVASAPAPASSGSSPVAKAPAATSGSSPSTADSLDKGEEVVADAPRPEKAEKPAEKAAAVTPAPPRAPVKPAEPHRETTASSKPAPAPAAAAPSPGDDAARARALLEGRTAVAAASPAAPAAAAATAAAGRFVVQVGAFGDAGKAQEARNKLTRGGLPTYVQSVDTKDGKRIRVRVGPFANKAEADRAAAKVKGLDLPASILTL